MLIAEVYSTYCISTDVKEMQNMQDEVGVQDCHGPGRGVR